MGVLRSVWGLLPWYNGFIQSGNFLLSLSSAKKFCLRHKCFTFLEDSYSTNRFLSENPLRVDAFDFSRLSWIIKQTCILCQMWHLMICYYVKGPTLSLLDNVMLIICLFSCICELAVYTYWVCLLLWFLLWERTCRALFIIVFDRNCPYIFEAIIALAELGVTAKDIVSLFPQVCSRYLWSIYPIPFYHGFLILGFCASQFNMYVGAYRHVVHNFLIMQVKSSIMG